MAEKGVINSGSPAQPAAPKTKKAWVYIIVTIIIVNIVTTIKSVCVCVYIYIYTQRCVYARMYVCVIVIAYNVLNALKYHVMS